jgi:hypothetical protein
MLKVVTSSVQTLPENLSKRFLKKRAEFQAQIFLTRLDKSSVHLTILFDQGSGSD